MKILFKGHFDVISGYGNSAVNICINLERLGCDVYPIALDVDFELPRDFTDLFTKKDNEFMDCAVVFALPNELQIGENWDRRVKALVAYTMWEQTRLSSDLWKFHKDYNNFTEVWVPCKMNVQPFSEITNKNISIMSLGVDTGHYKFQNRDYNTEKIKFCMSGALGYRKGSFIVLEAYRMLTEKHPDWNVELHLKTSQTFCEQFTKIAPRIFLHREILDLNGMRDFYYDNHVMVAPSLGEGFHQPPVEFMSSGGLVITTDWGGPEMWADPKGCLVVGHEMEDTIGKWGGALPNSQWAVPNVNEVLEKMEFVYENRSEAERIAKAGSEIAKKFDWQIVTLKMKERLEWLIENKNSLKKRQKS